MEPLQHPPGPLEGELSDPSIQALLRGLSENNSGLCVVTTREAVPDIEHLSSPRLVDVRLDVLSDEAGAELLKHYDVRGTDEELRQAVADYEGHSLSLILLGTYLRDRHGGDIAQRNRVVWTPDVDEAAMPALSTDQLAKGTARFAKHARKVMASYVAWFENEPEDDDLTEEDRDVNRAAVAILRLMGLFNRPADAGCLAAMRAEPPIPGLTDALFVGDRNEIWQQAIERLRSARLLADHDGNRMRERGSDDDGAKSRPLTGQVSIESLDAHPLIREHFDQQLATDHKSASKEAHRRLYEHLKQSAPERPDNLNDMMPLYHAVAHGCKAGLEQDALDGVYYARVLRGNEFFSKRKLGTFGLDLATIALFFQRVWTTPLAALNEGDKSFVLSEATVGLRALAKLSDAVQPMRATVEVSASISAWENSAVDASNLSDLSLTLGDVSSAVRQGEQSVELADRSGDAYQRQSRRTTLGAALFCAGDFGRRKDKGGRAKTDDDSSCLFSPSSFALAAFREAEAMQQESQPQYSLLYSLQGYRYCELLLGNVCQRIRGVRFQLARSRPNRSQRSDVPALSGAPETLHRSGNDEGERQGASPMALELSGDEVAERRKPPGVGESSGTTPDGLRRTATTLGPQEQPVAGALPLTEENVAEDAPAALRSVRPAGEDRKLEAYTTATRELQSKIESLRNRAEEMLRDHPTLGLLSIALHHLALGRTWQLSALLEGGRFSLLSLSQPNELSDQDSSNHGVEHEIQSVDESPHSQAEHHLTQSVALLRQSGRSDELPRGLLHRAALWRKAGERPEPGDWSEQQRTPADFFALAERDLSEAETIADRGSMLIWQIEAALERSRLFLALHEIGWEGEAPAKPRSGDASQAGSLRHVTNDSAGASPSRWLELARAKLEETRRLVRRTESEYEPHVPDWEEWEPPEYVGVFKKGDTIGYHCRNGEIADLEAAIERAEKGSAESGQ